MDGFFDTTDNTAITSTDDVVANANTDDSGIIVNPSNNTSSIVMGMSATDDYAVIMNDDPPKAQQSSNDQSQPQSSSIPMSSLETNPYEHKQSIDSEQTGAGDIFAGLGDDAQLVETEEEKDINAEKTDDEPTFLRYNYLFLFIVFFGFVCILSFCVCFCPIMDAILAQCMDRSTEE